MFRFNPLVRAGLDLFGSAKSKIPQLTADPVSPEPESAWVLASAIALPIQHTLLHFNNSDYSYKLKYRTQQGKTVSVDLT